MDRVTEKVIQLADSDVRRTLGVFRRINSDLELKLIPREEFVYYQSEKKLVYYEVVKYGYFYHEIITGIVPARSGDPHEWDLEPNARVRGVVWTFSKSENYDRDWREWPPTVCLAGIPQFVP